MPLRQLPLFLFAALLAAALPALAGERPALVVVIAIDQMRSDYLVRFRPFFAEGGFRRLLEGGAVFLECRYRHAVTKTAPGHATILSGVHAEIHGIVGNEWADRVTGEIINAAEDASSPLVGAAPASSRSPGGLLEAKSGRSPRNFLATTIGDQLRLRYGAEAKVFSVANKDRAAILLGGKFADSAYWIAGGRFVTSRYYRAALPAWIEQLNARRPVESFFGETWDRLIPAPAYTATQGVDDAAGEFAGYGLGRTLPKVINGGQAELSPNFYSAFDNSPFSTQLVGEFAEEALRREQLGRHSATDLLCIGFSQLDAIGHSYGPDSHEVMDSVLRLDRVLASFFAVLDKEVGLARCLVVLTADHGVCPLPERAQALRDDFPAGRFDGAALDRLVSGALDEDYGALPAGDFWAVRDNFGYHLRAATLKNKNLPPVAVAATVKAALLRSPQIAQAFTREEVLAMPAEGDTVAAMSRRSFFPARSQDVIFILRPYFVDRPLAGTNHGTPYDYDTHVPLVWFGAGVRRGTHTERVGVDDLAPTLAALIGVPRPPQSAGRVLFPTQP